MTVKSIEHMEKMSVIIPAYRAEKYLHEAVDSARNQKWAGETEIIVINDGSPDDTLSVARECADLVIERQHGGAAAARNAALSASTGTWVMFLDADDLLTSGAVQALYAPFADTPELMACFGLAEDFISPELTEEQRQTVSCREEPYGGILPGCALIRREVFDKIGMFDAALSSGETIAWQMKLRDAGFISKCIDVVTLRRRIHLSNTGRIDRKQEMLNYASILRKRLQKK